MARQNDGRGYNPAPTENLNAPVGEGFHPLPRSRRGFSLETVGMARKPNRRGAVAPAPANPKELSLRATPKVWRGNLDGGL